MPDTTLKKKKKQTNENVNELSYFIMLKSVL